MPTARDLMRDAGAQTALQFVACRIVDERRPCALIEAPGSEQEF